MKAYYVSAVKANKCYCTDKILKFLSTVNTQKFLAALIDRKVHFCDVFLIFPKKEGRRLIT